MQIHKLRLLLFPIVLLVSCATAKKAMQPIADISSIKFLGSYDIPYGLIYNNTTVGGLSGIDYDAKHNLYYLICDDRSEKNPARFYAAKIYFTQTGIDSVVFKDVKSLLQPNGNVYPNIKQERPDPEAMRYNPLHRQLIWSSEGERIVTKKETVLKNPSVIIASTTGQYIDSFALPANLIMQATEKGPRRNGVFEGLSFADNYKTLFVSVEEPLYEDGPRADVMDNNAFIRILKFDAATRQNTVQYAYKLSPVAYPANSDTGFKINGVPDILSIGNNKLLVLERSFSEGRQASTIKVFVADLTGATDISTIILKNNSSFVPATKKLLLNMDSLGIYTDNIEGMTLGPLLPNGHKTLLFIADNNFSAEEKAQVFLFEVIE